MIQRRGPHGAAIRCIAAARRSGRVAVRLAGRERRGARRGREDGGEGAGGVLRAADLVLLGEEVAARPVHEAEDAELLVVELRACEQGESD